MFFCEDYCRKGNEQNEDTEGACDVGITATLILGRGRLIIIVYIAVTVSRVIIGSGRKLFDGFHLGLLTIGAGEGLDTFFILRGFGRYNARIPCVCGIHDVTASAGLLVLLCILLFPVVVRVLGGLFHSFGLFM